MGKRELVALLSLSSWCPVIVVWLFFAAPLVCLQFVIMVFPDHTHYFFIYGYARKSYLQMLDPIHNQGPRLALGAFRSSPVASLYINHHYTHKERNSLCNML